ncbi:MAG: MFS transporter [Anaerolineae bacterium]
MGETVRELRAQPGAGTESRRGALIALYVAAAFLYWVSLYVYMPTLPTYVESKSENLTMVGTILSMYGLWQALIRLPLGIAADWLGRRKPFIIGGLLLAALGALVMNNASGTTGLLIGRSITGLAAGTWVPLIVIFSALFPPHEAVRASSLLTLVSSVSRMVATGITGSLNAWGGYALAFHVAAGAALVAVVIVAASGETRRPSKRPSLASLGVLITRRDVLVPSLLALVSQYCYWATTFAFVPILAQQLGASGGMQSALASLNIGVMSLGNLVATAAVRRTGARPMIYLGFVMSCLGTAGAALSPSIGALLAAAFVLGLSQGVSYPVLMGMSIEKVEDAQRTTAMGLHQAVYAIGMFAGPWMSGILADAMGIRPMFGVTAFAVLVLGVLGTRFLGSRHTA